MVLTNRKSPTINTSPDANNAGAFGSADSLSPHSETLIVIVMPCGREDGKNSQEEMPYEIRIRKKGISIIRFRFIFISGVFYLIQNFYCS